ncbi:MAG: hypothetical protein II969_13315 [Anaerolineaceae bacterium]|nr:hypothetical protein [Anaerolineaceae bacterium]
MTFQPFHGSIFHDAGIDRISLPYSARDIGDGTNVSLFGALRTVIGMSR